MIISFVNNWQLAADDQIGNLFHPPAGGNAMGQLKYDHMAQSLSKPYLHIISHIQSNNCPIRKPYKDDKLPLQGAVYTQVCRTRGGAAGLN